MRSRRFYLVILDALLLNLAAFLALILRFEGKIPHVQLATLQKAAPWLTVGSLLAYAAIGLYSFILRYASIDELLACASASAVSAGILWVLTRVWLRAGYSRSAIIITGVLEFIFAGGLRLSVRLGIRVLHRLSSMLDNHKTTRVLVVGAGDAGAFLGRELSKRADPSRQLAGYIDDDPSKKGSTLCGVKVLGGRELIPSVIKDLGIGEVIIAMPSAPREVIREVVSLCQETGVTIRTLPRLLDMAGKPFEMNMIKDIELEDLLGRPEVKLDTGNISAFINGKRVLVTGAGGSIGSEICRQVARFSPGSIIMLGHGENSIFEAKMALDREFPAVRKETVIADVRDSARINDIFALYRPHIVFHAAAHKHVPLMEDNSIEAIKTNVFGTLNVARSALAYGAEKFVLISTDKAVNPTSVMGATKRVAEMVVRLLDTLTDRTAFVSVRFGNVLGSRGSVVPVFKQQIENGGPVTVTHPEMRRYFMTISEAVQLVLQAATMGKGGEVFVLDMGEPVKIVDLAEQMIRLSGRVPYKDIPIVFTGIRPGEKLFEEILTAEEGTAATHHSQIYIAKQKPFSVEEFQRKLEKLESLVFPANYPFRVFGSTGEAANGHARQPAAEVKALCSTPASETEAVPAGHRLISATQPVESCNQVMEEILSGEHEAATSISEEGRATTSSGKSTLPSIEPGYDVLNGRFEVPVTGAEGESPLVYNREEILKVLKELVPSYVNGIESTVGDSQG
ncbi:MAG: polysaccharide biosynthesis protein [Candidatus Fermentithermobacillus carboniphilus]|uniref:Polysaccharide biosynthesis protein n=1 Tax=Candidatus Fermentithermobacillus carboniphilus TaxID=3085328 RepID=A0AAT9LF43_9FIRM|nr:MAG: polysaccharide biosynthesis protein [Candidatus Fermentithermobacillus carboniphilus]